jgi:AraC family transcriptional regulator of adaptative response / DNA-3-methyladenine glycosylase II
MNIEPFSLDRAPGEDIALFEGLVSRVRSGLHAFRGVPALTASCGANETKLGVLFRAHAHLTPAAWLRRERVRAAARILLETEGTVVDAGFAAGFESESVFQRQFRALMGMNPGAYRALKDSTAWLLLLPAHYRAQDVLAYHGRDPESPTENAEGNRIRKALMTPDGAVVLEIAFEREGARAQVHARRAMGRESMAQLHRASLRMLGLAGDVTGFEARAAREADIAQMVSRRRGLRIPLTATVFDGLCWGVIGQQINVKFAAALRREILNLAGEPVEGGMRAHPAPERVADLSPALLTARRYSRSKAAYLIEAARAVVEKRLDVEALTEGSAVAAETNLKNIHGIGTWTARYVMLRAGFADSAPVGDSALATALQRVYAREERPSHEDVARLMNAFSPYRSLATTHLWASLKVAA